MLMMNLMSHSCELVGHECMKNSKKEDKGTDQVEGICTQSVGKYSSYASPFRITVILNSIYFVATGIHKFLRALI